MSSEKIARGAGSFRAEIEIREFVASFESCVLPLDEWNHRGHLTVALWYLSRHDRETATNMMRQNLLRYIAAHGIVTTKDSGYHETITLFFMRVLSKHLSECGEGASILDLTNRLIETDGDKNLPLEYYSKKRLMSLEARTRWVEPDLQPLD